MDETESIYHDLVSVNSWDNGANGNSLYLSRRTVCNSAEEVRFGSVDSGADRTLGSVDNSSIRTTTDAHDLSNSVGTCKDRVCPETSQDLKSTVDYVLAFNGENTHPVAATKRTLFQRNLENEGLKIEIENRQRIQFVKIHVPENVLSRYCKIMKMKMPLKMLDNQDVRIQSTFVRWFRRFFNLYNMDLIFASSEYRLLYEYSPDKPYLFNDQEPNFFTPSIRIAVVNFILQGASFSENVDDKKSIGIRRLVKDQVYLDAYPLHDGCTDVNSSCQRALLLHEWGSFEKCFKHQPLDYVKEYFGVKIAMYFAWLGFYTYMLIPASVFGLICFCYGLLTYRDNRISQDICKDNETIMCPQCDEHCDYWYLNTTCNISKLVHIFDNGMTIAFSIFMSFWASLYLKMWKRYSSKIQHRWGITDYCLLTEPPRPQYLDWLKNTKKTFIPNRWFDTWLYLVLCTLVLIMAGSYHASLMVSKYIYGGSVSDKPIILPATVAIINLLISAILNLFNKNLAKLSTDLQYHRTQTEYNESFSLKIYLFEFVNYYTSIFYIAFIKGKFVGTPHERNLDQFPGEEKCGTGGCLIELCIQLGIIMVGKQFIRLITEIVKPYLKQKFKEFRASGYRDIEAEGSDNGEHCSDNQWTKDFKLINWNDWSLSNEYLKMVIQYGFITIFAVAFPLGPFFALVNNIFEIRVDAKKFLRYYKRSVPQRVRDIGNWYNIMDFVVKIGVTTNAFFIAFSSKLIPRLVYILDVSPTGTDEGFVNYTLAYFNITHFEPHVAPLESQFSNISICRYSAYPNPPEHAQTYNGNKISLVILSERLWFVLMYLFSVTFVVKVVECLIPDVPSSLQYQISREEYIKDQYTIRNGSS